MELAKTSNPILPSPQPVWLSGNKALFEHTYVGGKRKNKKTQKKKSRKNKTRHRKTGYRRH